MPPLGAIDGRALLELGPSLGFVAQRSGRTFAPAAATSQLGRVDDLRLLGERLAALRDALETLAKQSGTLRPAIRSAGSSQPAQAVSSAALDLEAEASATTLRSSAEVNAIPTSFTPFGPTLNGVSTTLPTLGGIYSGAQGDDTLTVEIRDTAVVGSADRLRVAVNDGAGNRIANLRFEDLAPGTPLAIGNGMTLALGAGLAVRGDTFTVDVFQSVGSAVDPTLPFDGVRNQNPNLEPGLAVGPGSFTVNGVAIAVAADDSIESVLARITASAAGVDASFDAASERVVLTQRTLGSDAHVVLGADSSGFLAATKLADAVEVLGQDGEDPVGLPISSVPALAGITSGSFSVNGVSLAVDVDQDSLADVLDRINASSAGVRATLDPIAQRVRVVPDDPAASLTLEDGTSGLWSALQVAPGRYDPEAAPAAQRRNAGFERPDQLREGLRDLRRALNALFADRFASLAEAELGALRGPLAEAASAAFGAAPGARGAARLGVSFDPAAGARGAFEIHSRRLAGAIARRAESLAEFLFAAPSGNEVGGLVPALLARLEQAEGRVTGLLRASGRTGTRLDVRV